MSPRSSQMQNVEPSRIVSTRALGPAMDARAARLVDRHDDELVDDDVQRAREGEEDAGGDVVRTQRPRSLVDGLRLVRVALEAHERELGLDEAAVHRRHADVTAEEVLAQGAGEAADGELRRDV